MRTLCISFVLFALSVGWAPSSLAQHPRLFRSLDFPAAQAAAKAENRLLLLDAMTSWCAPCKVMDKTTWVDPEVERWVAEHAVAIQLDMDRHADLKNRLAIGAFPTMVLFRPDGREFDRVVGLRKPAEMLLWLRGAQSGDREVDRVRRRYEELLASGADRPLERMSLASQFADLEAVQEASDLVVWLWNRTAADAKEAQALMRWQSGVGRQLSRELVRKNGALKLALRQARAQRSASLDATEDPAVRSAWLDLNAILDEEDHSARWASQLAIHPEGRVTLQQHEGEVFDLLIDRGAWAAAGYSLGEPLAALRFLGDHLGAYDVAPPDAAQASGAESMPAIPIGGMAPAQPVPKEPASGEPRVLPAIPIGGMQPAQPTPTGASAPAPKAPSEAEIEAQAPPEGAHAPRDPQDKQVIPAIPIAGRQPPSQPAAPSSSPSATTPGAASIPAIPLGGLSPASKPAPEQGGAMPAIPMTSPNPARPSSPEAVALEVRARLTHQLRSQAARRYGALLAAERRAEAEAVASTLLSYADDDASRAALVACALRAGQIGTRPQVHLDWLEAIARGAGR